jgi:acetyl-CoA carboxylase biotin carboxyl carrier protein
MELIAAQLAGTNITRLDLSGPEGQWLIVTEAGQTRISFVSAQDRVTVKAPHAGVLLTTHPLRSTSLVRSGDQVKKGQVIALLQAGPLLQSIVAPCTGTVLSMPAPEGALVGYGTTLFVLEAETSGR